MKKVLILTQIKLSDEDKELISNTGITKIAINGHAEYLKPDLRFAADYIADELYSKFKQPVITSRDRKGLLVNVEHSGSSLVDCVRWLGDKFEVLLIADNTVNATWQQVNIYKALRGYKNVYKFTKDGNFPLVYKSLKEFLNV